MSFPWSWSISSFCMLPLNFREAHFIMYIIHYVISVACFSPSTTKSIKYNHVSLTHYIIRLILLVAIVLAHMLQRIIKRKISGFGLELCRSKTAIYITLYSLALTCKCYLEKNICMDSDSGLVDFLKMVLCLYCIFRTLIVWVRCNIIKHLFV